MTADDLPRLPFGGAGVAGVYSPAGGAAVTLLIPEVEGLVGLDGDAVLLQYRVRDKAVGYDSGVCEARVPLAGVDAFEVRRPWLGSPRVVMRVRDLRLLEAVPGARGGEVVLQLRRADVELADDMAATIALRAAERALGGDGPGRPGLPPA